MKAKRRPRAPRRAPYFGPDPIQKIALIFPDAVKVEADLETIHLRFAKGVAETARGLVEATDDLIEDIDHHGAPDVMPLGSATPGQRDFAVSVVVERLVHLFTRLEASADVIADVGFHLGDARLGAHWKDVSGAVAAFLAAVAGGITVRPALGRMREALEVATLLEAYQQ